MMILITQEVRGDMMSSDSSAIMPGVSTAMMPGYSSAMYVRKLQTLMSHLTYRHPLPEKRGKTTIAISFVTSDFRELKLSSD